ncbi:hypothetical protein RRG08_064514 [Elysia crispata]|uniref:Uncharacterized protein n=1 Tax=Elysia crispata TaxID=231223 RepID=A0AAE1DXS8_9GAST|nr:hypothetical protein RRG08_064514 [Elysia crispata]
MWFSVSAPLRVERSQHSNGCHKLFRMSSDSCGSQCPRLSELRGLSTVTAVTNFSGCPQIHVVLAITLHRMWVKRIKLLVPILNLMGSIVLRQKPLKSFYLRVDELTFER